MATQKQGRDTLKAGGRIQNGLQINAQGGLRTDVKGRLSIKQVSSLQANNPNANIPEER